VVFSLSAIFRTNSIFELPVKIRNQLKSFPVPTFLLAMRTTPPVAKRTANAKVCPVTWICRVGIGSFRVSRIGTTRNEPTQKLNKLNKPSKP
jgi:hypothetical protein